MLSELFSAYDGAAGAESDASVQHVAFMKSKRSAWAVLLACPQLDTASLRRTLGAGGAPGASEEGGGASKSDKESSGAVFQVQPPHCTGHANLSWLSLIFITVQAKEALQCSLEGASAAFSSCSLKLCKHVSTCRARSR